MSAAEADSPSPTDPAGLSALAWALPLLSLALLLLAPLVLSDAAWWRWVHDETGVMELATLGWLALAVACAAALVFKPKLPAVARGWFALFALGAFYFLGEEASWGQHLLGFEPPAAVAENNLQGEFNLHNADAWFHDLFNEVPRTLAGVACVVGAGVLPWVVRDRRQNAEAPTRAWFWLVPTVALVLPGLLAWGSNLPEKLVEDAAWAGEGSWAFFALVAAADETKEYLIALAMALYALSARLRFAAWSRAGASTASTTGTAAPTRPIGVPAR